ncbi:MAG: AAA family ATPase [Bacillota bacterium]
MTVPTGEQTRVVGEGPSIARIIRENVAKAVVGNGDAIEMLLVALACDGHVLIEDVPGTGKTTLAKAFACSLGLGFSRIQCTPDLLPSDVTGINFYSPKRGEFEFRPGPIFTNVLLVDEINRATPRTQSSLLECMGEQQVTIDGERRQLRPPFLVLATQNPIEYEGTFPLPEAQLDRFLMKLQLGYLDHGDEKQVLVRFADRSPLQDVAPVASSDQISSLKEAAEKVVVSDAVLDYLLTLVKETRGHSDLRLGVSTRGSLAMIKAAKALSALRGRRYVRPDDIKFLARIIWGHRLVLSTQARIKGRDARGLLEQVLASIPVPVFDEAGAQAKI